MGREVFSGAEVSVSGKSRLFDHRDALQALDADIPLADKIAILHDHLRERYPFVDRVAIALYERHTDLLKTFIHSSGGERPLEHYRAKLANAPSLQEVMARRLPRVVNDLTIFSLGEGRHAKSIAKQGYGASYTWPMYYKGDFFGFIFVNSYRKDCFEEPVLAAIDPLLRVLALVVIAELHNLNTLTAALRTTSDLTRHRDPETGAHLERMARYSQLIAGKLADKYGFNDEFIEMLFLFSPLHDVGKIAIPDHILLKAGKLSFDEFEVMKQHVLHGREIIDQMLDNFAMQDIPQIELLRNIVTYHHEAMNGSGYPEGRRNDEIPIEARIIAVADVFDALTSVRPYKEAWDNERAFDTMLQLADEKLDRECVEAMLGCQAEIEHIQATFQEDVYR